MAVPPTIPTSFVPKSASSDARRLNSDLTGAFGLFAYFVFIVSVLSAFGVFGYGRLLALKAASTTEALRQAQAALDPATVNSFIRLRDQLTYGQTLLDQHVALSGFFTLLETKIPTTVGFSKIHLSRAEANKINLEGSGTAKTFNALAAASDAFATDGRVKDAIFSSLTVTEENTIEFSLTATLDPALVAFTPPPPGTTASTTTP